MNYEFWSNLEFHFKIQVHDKELFDVIKTLGSE